MQRDSLRPGGNFNESFRLYGSMLYKIAMVHLGSKEDVEEVMQETFIKLMYKAPVFRDQEHEKAWLIRVMTNQCKSMQASLWRRRVTRLDSMDEFIEDPEDRGLMENVLKLPFKYKAVIHLYYYEDYAVREIAEILQISESAVKMRLKRGRELLRMDLEEESK